MTTPPPTPISAHDHGNCELCDQIERDLAAAQSVERERCAKIVEQYSVEVAGIAGSSRSLKPLADIIRSGQ